MIVARQFIAWNRSPGGTRPVGYGVIGYPRLISRPERNTSIGPNHTVPYGTYRISNTFQASHGCGMPGYLHSIPTGQGPAAA